MSVCLSPSLPSSLPHSLLASLPLHLLFSRACSLARSLSSTVWMRAHGGRMQKTASSRTTIPTPPARARGSKKDDCKLLASCPPSLFPCLKCAPGFCVVQTGVRHRRARRATEPNDRPCTPAVKQDPGISFGREFPNLLSDASG